MGSVPGTAKLADGLQGARPGRSSLTSGHWGRGLAGMKQSHGDTWEDSAVKVQQSPLSPSGKRGRRRSAWLGQAGRETREAGQGRLGTGGRPADRGKEPDPVVSASAAHGWVHQRRELFCILQKVSGYRARRKEDNSSIFLWVTTGVKTRKGEFIGSLFRGES